MLTIWLTAGQLKLVVHNNHIGLLLIWSKAWNVTTAVSSMVIVHQGSRVADSWKQCLFNNKSNNVEIDEHLTIGCQQNLFNGFLAQLCGLFCFIKQLLGSKIKLSWTAGQLDSWQLQPHFSAPNVQGGCFPIWLWQKTFGTSRVRATKTAQELAIAKVNYQIDLTCQVAASSLK